MLIYGRTRVDVDTRVRHWTPRRPRVYLMVIKGLRVRLSYRPWLGFRPLSTWCVLNALGATTAEEVYEWEPKMKKVQLTTGNGGSVTGANGSSVLLAKVRGLVLHSSVTLYDDSSPRTPGWFTVRTRGSTWQVIVKDPDAGASLCAEGKTLDDALALANELVQAENAPWEQDPFLAKRKPPKRR